MIAMEPSVRPSALEAQRLFTILRAGLTEYELSTRLSAPATDSRYTTRRKDALYRLKDLWWRSRPKKSLSPLYE